MASVLADYLLGLAITRAANHGHSDASGAGQCHGGLTIHHKWTSLDGQVDLLIRSDRLATCQIGSR